MARSGPRDRKIEIQSFTTADDSFGNPVKTWAELQTVWADVIYGTGQERREVGVEGADQRATFRTITNSVLAAVTPNNRIVFEGQNWDIINVAPLDRDAIEYTAIRRSTT